MLPPAHDLFVSDVDEAMARERPGWVRPGWLRFDARWYLARYQAAAEYCAGDEGLALGHYLELGVELGFSPSPLFDEGYYLAQNPDVHELVRTGDYRSGFDHFCQHGHRVLNPHWLFDDAYYGRLHDDMVLENLDQHGFCGRYDHYLRSGQFERRMGHFLFDAAYYRLRAIEAGAGAGEVDAMGTYTHYLYHCGEGRAERRPSIYFEPGWYVENAAGAVSGSGSALEHYLCNRSPALFDPVPQFSEAFYRATYRDVAHAIDTGMYRNGYQHFVQFGAYELRSPRAEIDLDYYCETHKRVREDLRGGVARDAFAHLRLIGLAEGLAVASPDAMPVVTEPVAKQLFLRRARDNLALIARRAIDFSAVEPSLTVVMVLFNRFELSVLSLASLRDNFAGAIELILVDNASSDDTVRIADYITGARVIRLDENIGFLRAANMALAHAGAPALLYLNNDTELGHGAIGSALARLDGDESIGAVCGKVIRSHGALQEAGCIIWRDGSTSGYLRDAPALAPGANFVRDVDFGSAVFLLCRTKLAKELGGFDESFAPAYYEDADFCVRLAQAGYRTVYDPRVSVHHLEYGSAQNSEAAHALMVRGRNIFSRKHEAYLATKRAAGPEAAIFARSLGAAGRRVLILEDTVPLRRLGSGFVRANDVVGAIARAGHAVTVFPMNGAPYDIPSLLGDFPDTVEIMHDLNISLLENFLAERKGFYDVVWISRTHNFARARPMLEAAGYLADGVPIVLDTEAVATIRDAAFAIVTASGKQGFDFDTALRAEFDGTKICRHVTAVNRFEVDLLNTLGLRAVSLVGTKRELTLTEAGFEQRGGLLFVASVHQVDSPNLDSLHWYAEKILPALAREMDDPPVLTFAGHIATGIDLSAFDNHPLIKIMGPVSDLRPLYESHRVFVAPTRFAAGTPYKIYEAASFGLPCVATDLLARQLGWAPGTELLTAPVYDHRRFAAQIATLYRTAAIWTKLRSHAAARLGAENTGKGFEDAVRGVLDNVLGARENGGL